MAELGEQLNYMMVFLDVCSLLIRSLNYSFFFPDDLTTFWEADSGQFERQIFPPEARKKVDLGGAAGAPRGKKRQISGAEGAQKQKRQILGRRRPFYLMVYHLSRSN